MNANERLTIDQQVVLQLAEVASVMTSMLGRLLETHKSQTAFGKDVEHLQDNLRSARDAISRIAQILHEGNGQKPLISRVAVLEEKAKSVEEDLDKIEEVKLVSRKGKYVLGAALISGLAGLAASLISLLN